MAACIRVNQINTNSTNRSTLAVSPIVIPMSRIDDAKERMIYDPGLGKNRPATEIRKVNGEFILVSETLLEVQRQMEAA